MMANKGDSSVYLCPGCNVREPFEHRCHHNDGAWQGDPPCECPECTTPNGSTLDTEQSSV